MRLTYDYMLLLLLSRQQPSQASRAHAPKQKEPHNSAVLKSLSYGAPNTIRTYDLQFRKLLLYPAELWARSIDYFTTYSLNDASYD